MSRDIQFGIKITADGKIAVTELRQTEAALEKMGQTTRRTKGELDNLGYSLDGMQRSALRTAAAFVGPGALVAAVGSFGSAVFQAGVQAERTRRVLELVTGSAAAAQKEIGFIRDTANRLGLDLDVTSQSYAKFAAAARGTALEGQHAQRIFTAVAQATSALQLTAADTSGVFLALQQMISKGTVSAEELRGQLGERLPGAFQAAARAMGVSTAELGKMLEKGLQTDAFLVKFATEMERVYGQAGPVDTAQAQINRLGNEWELLKQAFADTGAMQVAVEGLNAITAGLKSLNFTAVALREGGFAGGLGASLSAAFGGNIGEHIQRVQGRLDDIERTRQGNNIYGGGMMGGVLGIQESVALRTLEALKAVQRAQALALGEGAYGHEARGVVVPGAARQSQFPTIDAAIGRSGGGRGGKSDAQRQAEADQRAYDSLIKSIREKTAVAQAEADAGEKLTERQRFALTLLTDIRDGTVRLTTAEKQRVAAELEALLTADKQNEARVAAIELDKETRDLVAAGEADAIAARDRAQEDLRTARERLETIGLEAPQLAELTAARLESNAALADESAAALEAMDAQGLLIQTYKDQAAALREQAAVVRAGEWKKTIEDIDRTFHDGFVRMLEGGKGSWSAFTDSLRNSFKSQVADAIYKMFLRPIVLNVVAQGANALGLGGGATGALGAAGGLGNALGLGNTLGGLLGGGSLATTLVGAPVAGIASALGASTGVATGVGAFAASAMPIVGAGLALYSLLSGKGGGPKTEGDALVRILGGKPSYAGDAGFYTATNSDAAMQTAASATVSTLIGALRQLGASGEGLGIALGFNTDPQGDAPDNISGAVRRADGSVAYSHTYDAERGTYAAQVEMEAKRVLLAAIAAADVDPAYRKLIGTIDLMTATAGELDGVLAGLTLLHSVLDFGNADPFKAYADSLEAVGDSYVAQLARQRAAVTAAAAAYDGSANTLAQLATATQERYQLELQLARQLEESLKATSSMFADSRRTVELTGLTDAQRYNFFDAEGARLRDTLASLTDPTQISDYARRLNESIMAGYNTLDEAQQLALKDKYLSLLDQADSLARTRYEAVQQQVREDNAALREEIAASISGAMQEAAKAIAAAAATPHDVRVDLRIQGDKATQQVGGW